eukprot:TRINITY_DN31951_c0_g1_i1.p1 TRINITY_DN31951_c0_g1~~TRINITY_DN31951_c0_g1_i1.p1  ORF type:complete len:210 (+),score=14.18 TRINITY_DN31951_c0_g1_i1:98-727(+)
MGKLAKRKNTAVALAPIQERCLCVSFAFEEVVKFDVEDLCAKKVTASRTQDHFAYTSEQLAYRLALTARSNMARSERGDTNDNYARARAELLQSSLDTDDETHLGLRSLDILDRTPPMPKTCALLDEEASSIAVPAHHFLADSDDCHPTSNFWSSSSTNSGSVMDRLRSIRNSFGGACASVTNVESVRFRWPTRKHRRVVPAFDDVMPA